MAHRGWPWDAFVTSRYDSGVPWNSTTKISYAFHSYMQSTQIDRDTITYLVTQYHNNIIVLASQTVSHHNLTENKLEEPSLVLNFQSWLPWFSSLTVWDFITPVPTLPLTSKAVTKAKIVAWAAASSKALALLANRNQVLQVKKENTNSCQTNGKIKEE